MLPRNEHFVSRLLQVHYRSYLVHTLRNILLFSDEHFCNLCLTELNISNNSLLFSLSLALCLPNFGYLVLCGVHFLFIHLCKIQNVYKVFRPPLQSQHTPQTFFFPLKSLEYISHPLFVSMFFSFHLLCI